MNNQSFFDLEYRELMESFMPPEWTEEELQSLSTLLEKDARILDCCGGYGRMALPLSKYFDLTVLDLSHELLKAGRQQSTEVWWIRGDARAMPFLDNSWDWVLDLFTSTGLMDNREDDLRILREIYRVLKSGAKLLLSTMHRDFFVQTLGWGPSWHPFAQGGGFGRTVDFDPVTGVALEKLEIFKQGQIKTKYLKRRLYTATEWVEMIREVGLELKSTWGDDWEDFGIHSPTLWILAQKPESISTNTFEKTLICPITGARLEPLDSTLLKVLNQNRIKRGESTLESAFFDPQIGRVYPVWDGIPQLVAGEALDLNGRPFS